MNDENYRVPRYYDSISDGPISNNKHSGGQLRNNGPSSKNNNVRKEVPQAKKTISNSNNVTNRKTTPQKKQTVSTKGPKNLNVRHENIKKHTNKRMSLKKRIIIGTLITAIISAVMFFATHIPGKIFVPEDFTSSGVLVEIEKELKKLDDIERDFILIQLNNWRNGISDNSIANMEFCENNNVPYGIVIESDAKTKKEAKADAACAEALLDGRNLSCPVYYDVRGICDSLDNDQVVTISETFIDELDGSYDVGVCVNDDYLIEYDNFDCEKLVVCNDYDINYTGEYNMCYFTETDEYYSNKDFSKNITYINEAGEDNIKGIDVSQYQGDINWQTLAEQDVNFVIMRFSSFYQYHDGASLNIDDRFYEYAAACEALDIPYGIYCYSTATTVAEAKLEAKTTLNALARHGLKPDLPIYYDAETKFHFKNPETTAQLTKAFCEVIESSGHRAGLYASYSLVKDMVYKDPSIKDIDKWIARYKNNSYRTYDDVTIYDIPDVSGIGKYNAVQITDQAVLDGIDANTVDVNFANDTIGKIY